MVFNHHTHVPKSTGVWTILGPFTSSSANAEVHEGRDLLAISCKVVTIEIVIVFKGMPKGLHVSWQT